MKIINVLVLFVLTAAVGAGWMLTIKKLENLERQICMIESRPLSLQDETKHSLEDLCKQVANNSATDTSIALGDRFAKSCEELTMAMRESQNAIDRLAGAVSNDWKRTCGQMLSDEKEFLRATKDECAKNCEEVRKQSAECVIEIGAALSKLADSNKAKCNAYLDAARANTNDYQVCELLYRAAIVLSVNKQPVMSEYARWCQKSVRQLVEDGRIDDADRRYTSLVTFFDSVIGTGSVSDICSISMLVQQLAEVEAIVDGARQLAEMKQWKAFENIEESVCAATNYDQLVDCRTKLDGLEVIDEKDDLFERKDQLDRLLTMKMSTAVPTSAPIIIPPVCDDTPWIAWLENFNARLTSDDLTEEARTLEFAQAGEFLAAAREIDDEDVKTAVEEIEKHGTAICRNAWRKTVMAAIDKAAHSEAGVQQCIELLAATSDFSEDEQRLCREELVSLNRAVVAASLREIRKQADSAKRLESRLSKDEYQQLLSMLQGQCLQMLVRLQELNHRFDGGFESDIDRVSVAVTGFSSVISGFNKAREVKGIAAQTAREQKFISWVRDTIIASTNSYQSGEEIAKKWFKTTSNDDAQKKYKRAWEQIMEVNSGDLATLDEALYKLWSKEKEKIENRYEPSDDDLKNRKYRGLKDF